MLVQLIVSFIVATFIITITHELGHYFAIESIGLDAEVRYKYTHILRNENYRKIFPWESFIVYVSGPAQTILTGTIGFLLMLIFKNEILKRNKLSFKFWVFIFLIHFWLRQVGFYIYCVVAYFLYGKFPNGGDEIKLATILNLEKWTITFLTAIIGLVIILITIFKFIPLNQRLTFIISGLVGGSLGCLIWFGFLGKLLLP